MDVLGETVSRARRNRLTDAVAITHGLSGRVVDYQRFCTTTWKVGNFLHTEGVRSGTKVVVANDYSPRAVAAFYGASLLGATVRFGSEAVSEQPTALVGPTSTVVDLDVGPQTKVIAYGADPGDPTVAYFERDVWSENPTEPPDRVGPHDPLLRGAGLVVTHRELLTSAEEVINKYNIGVGDAVAVRSPLVHPGAVGAGIVAPIIAGATILFPDGSDVGPAAGFQEARDGASCTEQPSDNTVTQGMAQIGTVAVGAGPSEAYPEAVVVTPADVIS